MKLSLTVELVPTTCWYSNVRSNVRPSTWDRLQREVGIRNSYRCEICGGRGPNHPIEAHEEWSYDDHRQVQRLAQLVALCPNCHSVKHIGHAMQQGDIQKALAWLTSVNKITPSQAAQYVVHAFKIHAIRSQFQWSLDVSHLHNQYGVKLDRYGVELGLNAARD